MAKRNLVEAINQRVDGGDGEGPLRGHPGGGCGQRRRGLSGDGRPAGQVRGGPGHRHPSGRIRNRGNGLRHGGQRTPAGGGDSVRRVSCPRPWIRSCPTSARIRTRSRGRFTCPLVIRSPFGGGIHAPEHHSDSPEALFAHTPGIKVVIPSSPYDAKGLINSAIRDPDPVLFFEPKRIYRAIKEEVPDEEYTVPIGKAKVVREGKDLTVDQLGSHGAGSSAGGGNGWRRKGSRRRSLTCGPFRPWMKTTFLDSVRKTGKGGHRPGGSPHLRAGSGDHRPDQRKSPPFPAGSGGEGHRVRYGHAP